VIFTRRWVDGMYDQNVSLCTVSVGIAIEV